MTVVSVKKREEATEENKHILWKKLRIIGGRREQDQERGRGREKEGEQEPERGRGREKEREQESPREKKSPKEDAAYTHNAAAQAGRRSV